jgi:hypothetical protein
VGGGIEVCGQLVIDAAQNPLLMAVPVLATAFLFAGHARIMTGGLPPVKGVRNDGGKPPREER